MVSVDRRNFLKMMGAPAIAAAVPLDLSKALAIPANNKTGSIKDVEHVIILMQENRSFDHYFGTLKGVRGYADPHPVSLPSGKSVFHQPDGSGELLPFRPDVPDMGQTFLPDPPHGWNDTHGAWNGGQHDQWVPNKGVPSLTYHTRDDLPYQYALADAFTVCDNYHCSLLGPTDPNRYHMWTGWVGNDGRAGGPVLDNSEAGYDWSTYPERLSRNGVSWRVYQDSGLGLDQAGFWGWTSDPFIGNYGDNSLLYFHQYQNAAPGSPLADGAKRGTAIRKHNRDPEALLNDFRWAVEHGELPQVSWIVAPEAYCEHPNWEPDFGTWYLSQVVDILASHPKVWSKMALFITYDEEGGFFDHLVPPTPPRDASDGKSTVSTVNEIMHEDGFVDGPVGLGMRVPMTVVSPWTRGGWVNSEAFDHTSLIRFLEARFGRNKPDLIESNITPWRRAVSGDLTSAFDFKTPNARRPRLPNTDDLIPEDLERQPDFDPVPPSDQEVPAQESGVRPARAIPYTLHAEGFAKANTFTINFKAAANSTAAVFHVRSAKHGQPPRTYTTERGKRLVDAWAIDGVYDLSVYGPNGFYRSFKGTSADGRHANLHIKASYDTMLGEVTLMIRNTTGRSASVSVADSYAGASTTFNVKAGKVAERSWSIARTHGWYDLAVTVEGDETFEHRYAGHLEDGEPSISDPRMGGLV